MRILLVAAFGLLLTELTALIAKLFNALKEAK